MDDLLTLLEKHPAFADLSAENREIYLRLAEVFQTSPKDSALSMTPDELVANFRIGSISHWRQFLQLPPVVNFVRKRIGENAQIASRKAISALTTEALEGDVGAAKHLNEIAGVLTRENTNKVVVLHQISRPTRR